MSCYSLPWFKTNKKSNIFIFFVYLLKKPQYEQTFEFNGIIEQIINNCIEILDFACMYFYLGELKSWPLLGADPGALPLPLLHCRLANKPGEREMASQNDHAGITDQNVQADQNGNADKPGPACQRDGTCKKLPERHISIYSNW